MLDLTYGGVQVCAIRGSVTVMLGFSKSGKRKGEDESVAIDDR